MYCACKRNIEACSHNHCCRKKAIRITFSEFVFVVLLIQHAKRMHGIILSSVACPARIMFFLPHIIALTGQDFRKKKLLNVECVLRFYLQILFETRLILRATQRGIIIIVHRFACKVPVILVTF